MNEKQTNQNPEPATVRPTKKQRDLLTYIEAFIAEHGYSPSYREIMNGLNYTSVATVSLHVNSLIQRGHLRKRDRSARSLEVVTPSENSTAKVTTNQVSDGDEKWLVQKVEHAFAQVEQAGEQLLQSSVDELYVLVGAMRILGMGGAAQSFVPRLTEIKKRTATQKT